MLGCLAHRGPDGAGLSRAAEGSVVFGHSRLSVIDLEGGVQPLWSDDGRAMVTFNGEIYDYAKHRARLEAQGHRFRTRSDTEVLLALYLEYGLEFLEHVNGEFSFAIWDEKEKRLFAARDRYGVKPFFYSVSEGRLIFASEAKAILAVDGVERDFNPRHLYTAMLSAPMKSVSPFKGIEALRPGHGLIWQQGSPGPRQFEYWAPRYRPVETMSPVDAATRLRAHFAQAVSRRLVADVPVCVYLSGGLDSSLVALEAARQTAGRTKAFTISFRGSEYDEAEPAARIAKALDLDHGVLPVSMEDIAAGLESCVEHVELHLANPSAVGKFLLSRLVRDSGYKVALTGEGSDELFGGYPYFKLEAIWRLLESGDRGQKKLGAQLLRRFRKDESRSEGILWSRGGSWRRSPRPHGYPSFIMTRAADFGALMGKYLQGDRWGLNASHTPAAAIAEEFSGDGLHDIDPLHGSFVLSRSQLAGYVIPTLGDRVEMAHSVEGRTPFLDIDVVNFTMRVPAAAHIDLPALREKDLLRRAYETDLPRPAAEARKHPFFSPDWRAFSRTKRGKELMREHLSPTRLREAGVFQPAFMAKAEMIWRLLPEGAPLRRRLDVLMGVTLSTQILWDRLIRQRPAPRVDVDPIEIPRFSAEFVI